MIVRILAYFWLIVKIISAIDGIWQRAYNKAITPMKKFETTFTAWHVPLDYVLLVVAGIAAYYLRFASFITEVRPVIFRLPWNEYLGIVLVIALIWVILFALGGLYRIDANRKLARDITTIVLASSVGFAGITMYLFFSLQRFDSRFLVLVGWALGIIFVTAGHILTRLVRTLLYRLGINVRRVIIIGNSGAAEVLKQTFKNEPSRGYRVVAHTPRFNAETATLFDPTAVDEVIFTDFGTGSEEALRAVEAAHNQHLVFKYSADLFSTLSSNFSITTVSGIPLVEIKRTRLFGWGGIIKRLIDIILGSVLFILSSPIYLITALAILIETGRPILYHNTRVGQEGKLFKLYKFRSMYQKDCTGEQFGTSGLAALKKEEELIKKQSIKSGPIYKIKDDPRVTPLGRLLRTTSIDELPQLLNVIQGTMSLVGPRPHQPREVDRYDNHHKIVLVVKPGLTGMAQISGRSSLSFEEEIKLDSLYLEQWSLSMDFIIILKTPFAVIKKDGVL